MNGENEGGYRWMEREGVREGRRVHGDGWREGEREGEREGITFFKKIIWRQLMM